VRFRYDGREFTSADRPLVPEISMYERQSKQGMTDWTESEQVMVLQAIALRRAGIVLTWDDIQLMSPADFEAIDEEPPDPTVTEPPELLDIPADEVMGEAVSTSYEARTGS
jgi:hypothetical protein